MSKRKARPTPESGFDEPRIKGTGLTLENVIENLYVGRTPEELVKQHPELSAEAIKTAKKQILYLAHYENRTAFYERMRVRHLIAALRPHPVVEKICAAFNNVTLADGMSLQQLICASCWGEDESGRALTHQEYRQLRTLDEINHWQAIKLTELDRCCAFAHCDPESFRYYVPARLIQDMGNSVPISWEVVNDLDINRRIDRFSLLNEQQKAAIASYLWNGLNAFTLAETTPDKELLLLIQPALDNYWLQYL
jgi:uncharacterized protein (DUF433 family)